jgi:hypothetical protein
MTSWVRAQPPALKRVEQKMGYFFETTDSSFCSNFLQYLYAYMYSRTEGRTLHVYDMMNSVGVTHPLIKNSFVDMSGVSFTDSMLPSVSSMSRILPRILANANTLPVETLRTAAQQIFRWNPSVHSPLEEIIKASRLPASFELGIYIPPDRVGVRALPIDEYVRAAKKVLTATTTTSPNIFIMSDSSSAIEQFKKKADASWRVFSLEQLPLRTDGRNPVRARLAAYQQSMTDLLVMQSIPDIICTLSSDVGKFLYLTVEHANRVVSLDEPNFTVYQQN